MRTHLTKLAHYLNNLAVRERVLVLLLGLIAIYIFISVVLFDKITAHTKDLNTKIGEIQTKVKTTQTEIDTLLSEISEKNIAGIKAQKAALQKQISNIDKNLSDSAARLATGKETARLLQEILASNEQLKVIDFKTHQSAASEHPSTTQVGIQIFEHHIEITVESNYFAIFRFLSHLQHLKQQIIWDELDYKVTDYPTAVVTLKFHTISTQKAWINV